MSLLLALTGGGPPAVNSSATGRAGVLGSEVGVRSTIGESVGRIGSSATLLGFKRSSTVSSGSAGLSALDTIRKQASATVTGRSGISATDTVLRNALVATEGRSAPSGASTGSASSTPGFTSFSVGQTGLTGITGSTKSLFSFTVGVSGVSAQSTGTANFAGNAGSGVNRLALYRLQESLLKKRHEISEKEIKAPKETVKPFKIVSKIPSEANSVEQTSETKPAKHANFPIKPVYRQEVGMQNEVLTNAAIKIDAEVDQAYQRFKAKLKKLEDESEELLMVLLIA